MEKVVLFGVGLTLEQYFGMYSSVYDVCALSDNNPEKWGKTFYGVKCVEPNLLKEMDISKIFILTMWDSFAKEITEQLREMKLDAEIYCAKDCIPHFHETNISSAVCVTDEFGNKVIIDDKVSINSINIEFCGTNNCVHIATDVRVCVEVCCVIRGDGNTLDIGKGTSIIGMYCELAEGGRIMIGEDCMLAHNIDIFQSACHPIFNSITEERINASRDVIIGNHVWIGKNVGLMSGFQADNGCIVGYGSVSSGKFGHNCTIAGNPARVIRKNVHWERNAVGFKYDYGI